MSQVTAPIIAITLVLLSVFVPIAFIPGILARLGMADLFLDTLPYNEGATTSDALPACRC
jgi:hypothetical protein